MAGRVEEEVRDQGGPPGLVHGAESGPVVAVEVLVEQQVVLPRGVGLQQVDAAVDRSAAVRPGEPDAHQPIGEVTGDLPQGQVVTGSGGVFDGEVGTEELVVLQQGPDDQVVDREPHRSTPVGVAAVHRGPGFGGFVLDGRVGHPRHGVGGGVPLRERPQAVGGQECVLVEQGAEQPGQFVHRDDRQQRPAGVPGASDLPIQDLVPIGLFQPAGEPLPQPADAVRVLSRQRDRGQRRDQPDEGLHLDRHADPGGVGEPVVEEAVLGVIAAGILQRVHDQHRLFEEFHDHVLIGVVVFGELGGQGEHGHRVVRHPCGAVGLVQAEAGRQVGTVDGADVVQAQEAATEQVVPVGVLPVEPPGEIQQQLVENPFQEVDIGAAVDDEHPDRGQRMDRRVDVVEAPFVRRAAPRSDAGTTPAAAPTADTWRTPDPGAPR